ncbi:hypothetical protein FQN49_001445 [Arthroderma sp. PD_2]|nr:hypothetical protein FQN49_001445 [Arthroderma sp. PD_2]
MLPRGDRYRSSPLPGGPYGLDPRTMTPNDIEIALQQAQQGAQGYDCFGEHPSMRHSLNSASPYSYPPRQEEQLNYGASQHGIPHHLGNSPSQSANIGPHDTNLPELVRRTNLAVSLANHNINPRSQFTQVHPMMCFDGRFPTDFRSPKTVESVKLLDVTQLDRILQEYKLPYDTRSIMSSTSSNLLRDSRDSISSSRLRQAKLQILFEHLGASRIVEQERQKRS